MDCTPHTLTPEEEAQDTIDRFHAYWEAQYEIELAETRAIYAGWMAQLEEQKALQRLDRWAAKMNRKSDSVERAMGRFVKQLRSDETGCLVWTGTKNDNGYAVFSVKHGHTMSVHRFFYTAVKGTIPDELELHHKCRNHACVRPDHLMPLIRKEHAKVEASLRTHCRRGHLYTDRDYKPDGTRVCHLCRAGVKAGRYVTSRKKALDL